MGKIFDALERVRMEKSVKTEPLFPIEADRPPVNGREVSLAKEFCAHHECSPKVVVLSAPDSLDAENFKTLRTQILFGRDRDFPPRTIMVTSSFPGEGKTFVSANLAASIAMGIDEHVLLMDCDLRRPSLHKMLGYNNVGGLHEYLTGRRGLPDLLIKTAIPKLTLLAAGEIPSNPTELLSSNRMEAFLEEVKGRYEDRFIVIDSTPAQATAEASVLAKHVDGVVLVVMARKSPKKAIERTIQTLGREKILGIVFNGYEKAHQSYHKYYKKYYSQK